MICICGGGTGGHLAIAKALGLELKKREIKSIFIGSTHGQDKMWFENSDIFKHSYFLPSSGVVNKRGFKKLFSLLNILKLSFACKKIFKEHEIHAVISVGGYSAAAPSIASVIFGLPLFIHEQNAKIGRLNAILKPFATEFFSSYHKDKNDALWDYPVGAEFFNQSRIRSKLNCVLFLGGSQGASFINNLALNLAPILNKKGIRIIHQCGKNELEMVRLKYEQMGVEAEFFDFSKEIAKYMNKADLCISRAGASSLWELAANALPTIFIPYPHAASDHQYYNAKFLADNNLAKILRQDEADEKSILQIIENIDLEMISSGLKSTIKQDASAKIIDKIIKICPK